MELNCISNMKCKELAALLFTSVRCRWGFAHLRAIRVAPLVFYTEKNGLHLQTKTCQCAVSLGA